MGLTVGAQAFNISTSEAEADESLRALGQSGFHRAFPGSQGYTRGIGHWVKSQASHAIYHSNKEFTEEYSIEFRRNSNSGPHPNFIEFKYAF